MIRFFSGLLMLCFFNLTTNAEGYQYEEGTHYVKLEVPVRTRDSGIIEITEYFSYGCPHCYRFEPIAERLKKEYPDAFEKMHVSFLSPKDDVGETMTKAFVVAKKIGISEMAKGGGYRSLVNVGENGGQEVPHLHFHIFGGEKVGKMVS